jgi:hypothetical protein
VKSISIKNKILTSYLAVCAIGLLLLLTGYSFTFDLLNYLFAGIIIIYPVVQFFRSGLKTWMKVFISLGIVTCIVLIANSFFIAVAFGSEHKELVRDWQLGAYKVELNRKQGWAGPPYREYDLIRFRFFGMLKKDVAFGYPDHLLTDSCQVIELAKEHYESPVFEFDECKQELHRTNLKR